MKLPKISERRVLTLICLVASLWILALESYRNAPEPAVDLPAPQVSTSTKTEVSPDLAVVSRVIDGDTVELDGGVRVRYIGMNAPESVQPDDPVECFGEEASAKNRELVEGKHVRLEKDVRNTDKYGRLLRYVYVGEVMINEELVRQGYAVASTYPPDVKYQKRLRAAQQSAREHQSGLWAACPTK